MTCYISLLWYLLLFDSIGRDICNSAYINTNNMKVEIDYLFNGYMVAYIIYYKSEYNVSKYVSPYLFESIESAYDSAIIELSNN